jgi:MFS family permease
MTATVGAAFMPQSPQHEVNPETRSRRFFFGATSFVFLGLFLAAGAPSPLLLKLQNAWQFPTWALTVAFATYALFLLLSLLVGGSLSDFLGRRRVLIGSLALDIAAMAVFLYAPNIDVVIGARAIQGVATGIAVPAFSAMVVELAPPRRHKLGALVASTAPTLGLALGAFGAGIIVQLTSAAEPIIFATLIAVFLFGIIALALTPETVSRRPGVLGSLVPHVSIPRPAKREFRAAIPVNASSWGLSSLYLGLAASIVSGVFHIASGLLDGLAILILLGSGAIASYFFTALPARLVTTYLGQGLIILGIATLGVSVLTHQFPIFILGTAIGGVGFGASFSGAMRLVTSLANASERADLFSGIYVINYISLSIPVLVGGALIAPFGLDPSIIGYLAVILFVAVLGFVGQILRAKDDLTADETTRVTGASS